MKAHLFQGLRHLRRGLFYTSVIVLILLAMAVAIADRTLPLVQKHPDRIAAWLIARSGQQVHFDRAEAHWTNRGPVFALYNLKIGEGRQQLAVDRAELLVAMYSGMLPGHPFTELRLHGLAITVERDASGRWRFVGLSGPKDDEHHDPLGNLEGLGELQVTDARLIVRSPSQGFAFTSPRVALRMRVYEKRLQAGVRVDVASGAPLVATLDFDRIHGDGSLWIGGDDIDLAPWTPLLDAAGARIAGGRGQLGLWSTLKDRRVVSVQVEASLRGLALRSHAAIAREGESSLLPQVDLGWLGLSARLRKTAAGWDVVAPRVRLRSATREETLDGLEIRQADGFVVAAPKVDAGLLLSVAMLSDRVPAKLREWMAQASPAIRLANLRAVVSADGSVLRGSARLEDASWQPVARIPSVQHVSGSLLFDRDAISLTFEPPKTRAEAVSLWWPPAFGDPVPLSLEGTLTAWREGRDWTLESSDLKAGNDEFGLDARLAMRFKGDGGKPRLDLYADLHPAPMLAAKHYWLRHKMPPKTVQWLDNAIEGGQITGGHVFVAGDLDDWPFKHDEGKFEAVAELADATIHFSPEWPRAEHTYGHLAFVDDGMHFEGNAAIAGLQASRLVAAIPDFHAPVLGIEADTTGSGAQMLALMRQSPLQKKYAETFNALDVQGEGQRASLRLQLPLHHELGEPKVDGEVVFNQARLSDRRWNLAFTDVAGALHYDQTGVRAEALNVRVKGDPAVFHLAVGGDTGDPATAVDAQLRGVFPVATLLEHAPSLDWLKPIVQGRGTWNVEVKVPGSRDGARPATSQLIVRSDLRGVALAMPAPLGKGADGSLPLQVTAPLPATAGDITVKLGDLVTVRGRYDEATSFRGLVAFGADASGALPAKGLVVTGKVDNLDAAGWVGFAGKGSGGSGGLQSVDVQAGSLALGGRHFADTHVRLSRQADVTTLRLDGDALAGSISVPADLSRGIRGQFARLYWPGSVTASNGGLIADADDGTSLDPSKVPPLRLDVADVRFGEARLGHLVLQTRPIPQGMHIDQLDATAKTQTISATGDWTHNGGSATRTRLAIGFQADSLGKMLDAFGFKGVVAAGKTQAKLQASWGGSPTSFRLAVLDGTLDLDVGEGRLLEVKPGAGRVLGLVSLSELPRRLTLDFRDFFDKGFAFNSMKGRFTFANGVAHTDGLSIKGPAADIKVVGAADLVAQKYDQTIEVLPKSGGLVTGVGMLVGGPVGAAVGAVAGEVLKKPLQHMGRKRYHVSGPWNSPDVQPVRVETNTASVPTEPVSG